MITKKLWTELVTSNNFAEIIDTDITDLAEDIDELMNEKFGVDTYLKSNIVYISTAFFSSEDNNQWGGLPIYLSSYSIGDKRYVYLLKDKLIKYLAFYKRFITNDGLAKHVTISRDYEDHTDSTNTRDDIHSELPQIELDNFEDGIKYASTMDKNTDTLDYDNNGENSELRTETTWDEAMENLRTMLFNDLTEYVFGIPNMLYNHYSLDTMPYMEQIKATYNYLRNMCEMYQL